jgi:hypothetical protein
VKKWVFGLTTFLILGSVIALLAFKLGSSEVAPELPTIAVLPTNTATNTPTITPTPTATATLTPTATNSPTATLTPSSTPTLATLILRMTADDSRSTVTPSAAPTLTATPTTPPTSIIPSPPPQIPAASTASAVPGWIRYETNTPAFEYTIGRWYSFKAARASGGSYMYSGDPNAVAVLPFEGAGLRLRYVAYTLYGIFEIRLDGRVIAVVDSYRPRAQMLTTDVFGLVQGKHTLEIVNTGRRNPASGWYTIALDAVEIYQGIAPTDTPIASPTATATFTPSPAPVKDIKLISGPPTLKPTNTPLAPVTVTASLVIAYDENGNNAVDPAEGVSGISVRLVKITTNEILASGFTNTEGFIRLQTLSDAPVRLVVPYFGKFWDISFGGGAEPRFTLILPPGNQPGLIP